jgi:hypothetical protein
MEENVEKQSLSSELGHPFFFCPRTSELLALAFLDSGLTPSAPNWFSDIWIQTGLQHCFPGSPAC